MKYKVGDRVKIKSWDQMAEEYGVHRDETGMQYIDTPGYRFIEDMKIHCGNTMEIQYIFDNAYMMIETGYTWTDEMIECIEDRLPDDATYNDLEPDMLITYKSGNKYFITIINENKWLIGEHGIVSHVPTTATQLGDDGIKKVEKVTEIGNGRSILNPKNSYIIWKAPEEMTVAEAEEKLEEILKCPVHIKINS